MNEPPPAPPSDAEGALDVDALRSSALDALGAWTDPAARQALLSGELTLEADVTGWEASAGRVRGHRVTLLLDADRFADVHHAPALMDALCAAVAIAVSGTPGHALADFVVRSSNAEPERRSPYRSPP